MTAVLGTTAGAVSNETMNWHDIEWEKVHRNVRRLQARIVKATNRVLFRKAFEMLEPCEGRLSRTAVCPAKAGVFSGRQSRRGKSQEPRS